MNDEIINQTKNEMGTGKNFDIGIIDYGINNLKSVVKSFEKIGKTSIIIDKPKKMYLSKALVLPGIGAFGDGMNGLKERGLIEPMLERVNQKVPLLGICLGMQMLFSESEEFGLHKGLDLIKGRVIPFKSPNEVNINGYKVPHMGWNELYSPVKDKLRWQGTLLENTKEKSCVYFVHSFYPLVGDFRSIVATSIHGNQEFCAVVKKDNVMGTQFHPEKSGTVGLEVLKTWTRNF